VNKIPYFVPLVLLGSLLAGCPGSNSPASPASPGPSGTAVLYIMDNDTTSSGNYQSFLNANGYNVKVVTYANAPSETMTNYKVIIIGQETYNSSAWLGSGALVTQIKSSHVPVLGNGKGGTTFFDAAGVPGLGWAAADGGGGGVSLCLGSINSASAYWRSPNNVTSTSAVTLYNQALSSIEFNYGSAPPGTSLVGYDPTRGHYSLLYGNSGNATYFEWGYTYDPTFMTTDGKNLLLNVMQNIQTYPANLIDYPNVGTGGNNIADGLDIVAYPGISLSRVVLWISSNTAGTFAFSLGAADSCFGGTTIGLVASGPVTLDGNPGHNQPVTFTYVANPAVTLGNSVALSLAQATGPAATCYFSTLGDYNGLTGSSIGVNDLNNTTPCLSTLRGNGYAILVFGNP
jgi:hypothetical protein